MGLDLADFDLIRLHPGNADLLIGVASSARIIGAEAEAYLRTGPQDSAERLQYSARGTIARRIDAGDFPRPAQFPSPP
jgi:hypothetical protein